MPLNVQIFKVFLASPSDITEERLIVNEVIEELNINWARSRGIVLSLYTWESHTYPGFSADGPQDVINQQIPDDYNIFIGILWSRYGTPTRTAQSGTEEEFMKAYARWQDDSTSVHIMFYFKNQKINPQKIDPNQLGLVQEFKNSIREEGYYRDFVTPLEFQSLLRQNLIQLIDHLDLENPENQPDEVEIELEEESIQNYWMEETGVKLFAEESAEHFENTSTILKRITKITEELGRDIQLRTKEIKSAHKNKSRDLNAIQKIINSLAHNMMNYSGRMKENVRLYTIESSLAVDKYGRAVSMVSGTQMDKLPILTGSFGELALIRTAIEINHTMILKLANSIRNLSALTSGFNQAKRETLGILDDYLLGMSTTLSVVSEIEVTLQNMIKSNSNR